MTYKTTEVFGKTGEVVERDSTDAEIAFIEALCQKRETIEAEKLAKEAAKSELLAKLGITEDEAKLLLS
jgi:hypothetical protein